MLSSSRPKLAIAIGLLVVAVVAGIPVTVHLIIDGTAQGGQDKCTVTDIAGIPVSGENSIECPRN